MTDAQKALQAIREQRDNPTLPVPSVWNPQFSLRKYQRVGVSHLLVMQRFLLGHCTGSGKTIMGLYAWGILRDKRASRLLVVAPKSAVSQWCEECERFLLGVPITEVPPSEEASGKERHQYYQEWMDNGLGSMLCLNWSQYLKDWDFFEKSQESWKEGTWVILDECQRARNPKSKVYAVTKQLSKIVPRIHGFTATPIRNKAHDALHLLNLLSPGTMTIAEFERKYALKSLKKVPMRTGKGGGRRFITVKVIDGYKDLDKFAQRVSHLLLAPPESEMDLERPVVQTVNRRETMSSLQRRIYDDAERGIFLEKCDSDAVAAAGSLSHAQIAASSPENFVGVSGPLDAEALAPTFDLDLFDRPDYQTAQDKNTKLSMLKELLGTELEDQPVIIYSPFATSIIHLAHALQDKNPAVITGQTSIADRDRSRNDFQNGETNLILITDAGGEALNLQRAGHVIFYSLPWSIGQYLQVIGRARRFGSTHKYLGVWHLLMKDSVDELVESILQPKAVQFETMLSSSGQITGFSESMPVAVARKMRKLRIGS